MKLIALRNLTRVPSMAAIQIDKPRHENMIHKGATFEIGTATEVKALGKEEKHLVALLFTSGAVADANDEAAVKRIQAELAEEAQSKADQEKLHEKLRGQGLAAELLDVFQKLAARAGAK